MRKERIDKLLMERGIVQSRERARALIMTGKVMVGGRI
ncbi:MAG: S4 domain-containing protein, partial [Thermodesulfobacteriota bacterium]